MWKHHPVTKTYLEYLGDYVASLRTTMLAYLEETPPDQVSLVRLAEYKGRVNQVTELMGLEFSSVQHFYGLEEEEDAGKVVKDYAG